MKENEQTRKEEVELSFIGLDADKGTIDARDLTKALKGWCDYWEITSATFFYKELSAKPFPPDSRPEFKIKALKYATFDVFINVILPLGLMIGYDVLKLLWKWQKSFLEEHIRNKKTLTSKEQAIGNIEKLAKSFDIQSRNKLDTVNFVDFADDSLVSFVEPIYKSSKKISIIRTSTNQKILLGHSDKLALTSGYHLEPSTIAKQLERFKVKFIRIHTETGNAIITFDNPDDIYKKGNVYATIMDPKVHKLKNEYSRAFYEGTSLEVWGRKVFNKANNKFRHWEISHELPYDDSPLFAKKKN